MKREIVQDLIQFLGMIGIIGSLIFVGLQMQQTQRIAIAGSSSGKNRNVRKPYHGWVRGNLTLTSSFITVILIMMN